MNLKKSSFWEATLVNMTTYAFNFDESLAHLVCPSRPSTWHTLTCLTSTTSLVLALLWEPPKQSRLFEPIIVISRFSVPLGFSISMVYSIKRITAINFEYRSTIHNSGNSQRQQPPHTHHDPGACFHCHLLRCFMPESSAIPSHVTSYFLSQRLSPPRIPLYRSSLRHPFYDNNGF